MKKIFFIVLAIFMFNTIDANNFKNNDSVQSCDEYASNAAKNEVIYYGDWGGYSRLKKEWMDICNDVMGGDPSTWEEPMFCDLSCWP